MVHGRLASVTVHAIRAEITSVIVSRGIAYWRSGQVRQVTRHEDRVTAFVSGSRTQPYRVSCLEASDGTLRCQCSCPYARDWRLPCKHAVATLAAWIEARDQRRAQPFDALPHPPDASGRPARDAAQPVWPLAVRQARATAVVPHPSQPGPRQQRLRRLRPFLRGAPAWLLSDEIDSPVARLPMAWLLAGEFFGGSTLLQGEVSVEASRDAVLVTLKALPSKRQATFRVPRVDVPNFVAQCRQASDFTWRGEAKHLVLRRRPIEPCLIADYDPEGRLVLAVRYALREGTRPTRWLTPEELDAGRCGSAWWWGSGGIYPIAPVSRRLQPYLAGERQLVYDGEAIPTFLETDYQRLIQEIAFRPSEAVRRTRLLPPPTVSAARVEVDGPDWLWCELRYQCGDEEVALREILSAQARGSFLRQGRDWMRLPDREALRDALGHAEPDTEGRARMTRLQYLRARAEWDPRARLEESEQARRFRELIDRLTPAEEPPMLGERMTALRPYQQAGYRWLWFLRANGFHGLLADEMGLGKTHQAMAFLSALYSREHEPSASPDDTARSVPMVRHPSLVVCPTTVLGHWEDKLRCHAPRLTCLRLHGADRPRHLRTAELPHIVLTTYQLLVNDLPVLAEIGWTCVILDEAQQIKNPATQAARAVKSLRADHRVALTGTPIENRPMELWSVFEFLLPGYLGSARSFRERFDRPIVQTGDAHALERLRRLVHPFKLRRAKADVLQELPPKIEDVRICELTPHQVALYRSIVEQAGGLIDGLRDRSRPIEYLHIFAVLTRLKRLCDHPTLILQGRRTRALSSGKLLALQEILDEALAEGQKVVIFSQYLEMLDLIAGLLTQRRVGHVQLRGDTRDRRSVIDTFQRDPTCRVFLGSLLAGGLGIDLTAASLVIHYDRWWNAAREDQATDRVHRFGQTRGVQVIKLVTKGTLEERIHRIIERKRGLMDALITTDHAPLKSFTREELLDLLETIPDPAAATSLRPRPAPRRRLIPLSALARPLTASGISQA